MIVNEQNFDERLKRIGDLYEEGKDCLAACMPPFDERAAPHSRLYEILREMRDIACVQLKANHEVKDN